ncbi:hypothetical protein GGI25_001772 [Coemansia spiralis]|uniref:Uncharacterized protein n=2 Tax=Coemansia TaxID=4863 RepID=A0A9W8KZ81_9FUNG|nr:hypothetical protein EDC05_003974 [Coemansia umbellata]KAJ2624887.1 hypothetical protein GGI26_000999 [Coemansia sp. RSA 1358]KAJ2679204.1 hypothetical protein GGI25_001772 [Coemansia spiralis]
MEEATSAIQDLMRDTARLFEQASKLNAQLLQIDSFVENTDMRTLFKNLEQCKSKYKESLAHAQSLSVALETSAQSIDLHLHQSSSDIQLEKLQKERDTLYEEAVDKSEQIRRLLDCARQLQLTSAQLLQI